MKGYWKIIVGYSAVVILLGLILHQMLFTLLQEKQTDNDYKVQINRYLTEGNGKLADLKNYPALVKVESVKVPIQDEVYTEFFIDSNDSYKIVMRGNVLYRFTYKVKEPVSKIRFYLNGVYLFLISGGYVLLLVLYRKIIRPFQQVSDYPLLLAKGELTPHITVKRGNYFGKFVWGLNMLRDHLAQQRKNEMELYKERQTLILSISHDIKTPLQTIKLYAQALKKGIVEDEDAKMQAYSQIDEKAEEIQRSVNDIMVATTRQFLDFSVETGEFYLYDLLEQVKKTHQERLKQEGVQLKIVQTDNYLLQGDWKRYCEIMDNLMDNSLKYGDHRQVCFSTSLEEDCVLLTMENTGCTLNPEELIYIFDSFRRGFNHTHLPGSGLGLYIVKNLMKQMKGEVYARIQEEKFQITLVIPKAS